MSHARHSSLTSHAVHLPDLEHIPSAINPFFLTDFVLSNPGLGKLLDPSRSSSQKQCLYSDRSAQLQGHSPNQTAITLLPYLKISGVTQFLPPRAACSPLFMTLSPRSVSVMIRWGCLAFRGTSSPWATPCLLFSTHPNPAHL